MLAISQVSKAFDGRTVVNRVSFDTRPGEILALLGPNGAGKTTLIRMITDILRPDSGTIRLEGLPEGGDRKRHVGYLPEERGLYRRSQVAEMLAFWGQLKGLKADVSRRQAIQLLERVGLEEWASKQVAALSKGMQQKVQLCTALIGDPRLLILDEPFSGLDPLNIQLLEEILDERRAGGTTVLLSTHQMNKVEQLCDRALMIHQGEVVLYGSVRDIRREHAGHAVVVRTPSPLREAPGVRSIETVDGGYTLTLERDTTPQSVLRALVERGVEIESFSVASLPLEDVFVKVVREGKGNDRERREGLLDSPTAAVVPS